MRSADHRNALAFAAAMLSAHSRTSAQLSHVAIRKRQHVRTRRDGHVVIGQQTMVRNLQDGEDIPQRSSSALSMPSVGGSEVNNDEEIEIKSDQPTMCKSVIAVGKWRLSHEQQPPQPSFANTMGVGIYENEIPFDYKDRFETDESFVCELSNGLTLPIEGTVDQMNEMRKLLNSGSLVSAQSTVEVNINSDIEYNGGDEFINSVGDGDALVVALPPGPVNLISNDNAESQGRRLAYYEGAKKVLVVRVTDVDGRSVSGSADYVSNKFFGTSGDEMTMKSGFDACSFGKFTISNDYEGQVDESLLDAPGVLDVKVNIRLSESSQVTVREASLMAAKQKLGMNVLPGPFDYVVLVVEDCYRVGGTDCNFAAYAYVNSWLSLFVADYYKYPAVQMHEIGHNINLAHSGGLDGQTYTDHTCLMGNPLFSDDVGKMCFNPVKNYQINRGDGWFDDSNVVEFDSGSSASWAGKIIGIAEYGNNPPTEPIVVKLESGGGGDWFVGFNRATGPNADNVQGDDAVTIYRVADGNGFGYSTSSLKDLLHSGHSTTISNWRSTGSNLVIRVNEINTQSIPGYAHVNITFGGTVPPGPGPGRGTFFDWLISLPPGLALSMLLLGILLFSALLYVCCCKRKSSVGRRCILLDDEPYSGEHYNIKGATNLSYVGRNVHSALQRYHHHHHRTLWNATSGRMIGQLDYTPRGVWDTSSDPGEGHDDWFPEKLAEIIGRTEAWCDVMTLGRPDGKFMTAFQGALLKLAHRSIISNVDGDPIVVRIVFGNYPAKPVDCNEVIENLTKHLPKNANLNIWVGAWRKGLSWNHAKLLAVDGVYLHTGGHNMWEEPYLSKNPVHDLSLEMEGKVARDGHHFADQQWKFIQVQQSTFMGCIVDRFIPDSLPLIKRTRVTVSEWPENDAPVFPPQFKTNKAVDTLPKTRIAEVSASDVALISIGRQGSMVSKKRPSDDAILAMINSSRSIIRLIIQDLGPIMIPGTKKALPGLTWPREYLAAIGRAIYERGVDIELILSNPRSTPGGLEGEGTKDTPYGNGWDCVDAASEIVKAIQRENDSIDDAKLRTMITENLRICFIRHNKSSTYSDGSSIGLHSKHFIVDNRCCYIGSQNLYDCDLAEWGVVIDDEDEVGKILEQYFVPMWRNSYIPGRDVDVGQVMDGLNVDRDG